jgi:hypothetical protein
MVYEDPKEKKEGVSLTPNEVGPLIPRLPMKRVYPRINAWTWRSPFGVGFMKSIAGNGLQGIPEITAPILQSDRLTMDLQFVGDLLKSTA